jgi:hypothetical protein
MFFIYYQLYQAVIMHKQIAAGVCLHDSFDGNRDGCGQYRRTTMGTRNPYSWGDIVEQQREFGILDRLTGIRAIKLSSLSAAAPIAISGDSVYIAWPANTTGNDEVMFRASNDGGTTFMEKINLSNSSDTESQDVEIAADGSNVVITWWERNATSNEPMTRISSDTGETFGPLLKLSANGTIGLE